MAEEADFVLGYDEAGEGLALVLVHAFPLDRRMWDRQLEALSDLRRVIAVDLRGRGKSPRDAAGGWSIDDHAGDLARTIDSLGTGAADLAGISMGGYVLFSLWRRHPDKIRSLILIDTRAEEDSPQARHARLQTAALAREKGTGALIDELLPRLLSHRAPEQVRARVRVMFEETPGETAAADALAMRDRSDSTMDLTSIDVPALVVHGVEDTPAPLAGAEAMARLIPEAGFVPIPAAGHLSPMENPEAVNLALREFLRGLD